MVFNCDINLVHTSIKTNQMYYPFYNYNNFKTHTHTNKKNKTTTYTHNNIHAFLKGKRQDQRDRTLNISEGNVSVNE